MQIEAMLVSMHVYLWQTAYVCGWFTVWSFIVQCPVWQNECRTDGLTRAQTVLLWVMSNDICKLHRTAFHQVLQGNSSMFYSVKVAVDFEECCPTGSALILLGLIKLLEVGFHFSTFSIWICVLVLLFCPCLSGLSLLMIMQQFCRSLALQSILKYFKNWKQERSEIKWKAGCFSTSSPLGFSFLGAGGLAKDSRKISSNKTRQV